MPFVAFTALTVVASAPICFAVEMPVPAFCGWVAAIAAVRKAG